MKPEFSIYGDSKISGGSIPLSFPPAGYSTSSVSMVYNLENRLPTLSGFDGYILGLYLLGERPSPEKVMQSLEEKIPELSFEGLLENTHFKLCEDGKVRYKGEKNPKEFGEAIAEIYGRIATEWATEISKYDPKVEKIDGEMEERIIERIKNEFHKRFDPTGIPREWLEEYADPDYFEAQNTTVPETNPNIYPQPPKAPSVGDTAVPTTNLPASQQGSVYSRSTTSQENVTTKEKTENEEGWLKGWLKRNKKKLGAVIGGGILAGGIIGVAIHNYSTGPVVLPGEKVIEIVPYKDGYAPQADDLVFYAEDPYSSQLSVKQCHCAFLNRIDISSSIFYEKKLFTSQQIIDMGYHPENYKFKVWGKETKISGVNDINIIEKEGRAVIFARNIETFYLKGDSNTLLMDKTYNISNVNSSLYPTVAGVHASTPAPTESKLSQDLNVAERKEIINPLSRQLAEASA